MTRPIDKVKESLRLARSEAQFDIGRRRQQYPAAEDRLLTSRQFRQTIELARWGDQDIQRALRARLTVPTGLLEELTVQLRLVLRDYLDPGSDRVGHAFPFAGSQLVSFRATPDGLFANASSSSVMSLAKDLIRGAAVLDLDQVCDSLDGWTQGEPVRYFTSTVVDLSLTQEMKPLEGILFSPLPLSTEDLAIWLPSSTHNARGDSFLGRTVVSVASEAQPALFRPNPANADGAVTVKLSAGIPLETLWDALALVCNDYIQTGLRWNDYRDWLAMTGGIDVTSGGLSRMGLPTGSTLTTTGYGSEGRGSVSVLSLAQEAVRDISNDVLQETLSALQGAKPNTRMATRRWRSSIRPIADMTDRFIDLRIVLESLFLKKQPQQEIKFRLAANAAWLLGDDVDDRRRIWDTIGSTYGIASKAIHTGEVKSQPNIQALLEEAQKLCRAGILLILDKRGAIDWENLIFGGNIDSRQTR